MFEEATGTIMYEMKKEDALKTLENKKTKVNEIDIMLAQNILPTLEKLSKEWAKYMQLANGNSVLDRLKWFFIYYEFVQASKVKEDVISGVEQMKSNILQLKSNMGQLQIEIDEKEKSISDLTADKEKQMGGELKFLSEKVDTISNVLVIEKCALTIKKETINVP